MVANPNGLRGEAVRVWARHWRRVIRGAWRMLRPIDVIVVAITHVPIMMLDELSVLLLRRRLGEFPRILEPAHGAPTAAVVLAPGLQQTTYSVYWMGLFLARFFPFRVLFVQTPENGNHSSFKDMVTRNLWIAETTEGLPLFGVGFSKGGLDLVWLWHALLVGAKAKCVGLLTISTPFKGTALSRLIKAVGADAMHPGSRTLRETRTHLEELRVMGVCLKFFCALLDRICRRSDARPEREGEFQIPSKRTQLHQWLVWIISGMRQESPRPWWWATTLPHIGHTALYNPIVWLIVGVLIERHLYAINPQVESPSPPLLEPIADASRCA